MYRFIEDPGHGWLEVPLAEVHALGIPVSAYSYRSADFAYLEEDVDFEAFVRAKTLRGQPVEFVRHYQDPTPVRRYARWG